MPECLYLGRRATVIENTYLRVTVLQEGGHIAAIHDKAADVNPLWIPPWNSCEPSAYTPATHPEFGTGADARLLAGIMGHNVCLDLFGGPSEAEAAAGMTAHGEAPVQPYLLTESGSTLTVQAQLPEARLAFRRVIALHDHAATISETVENLSACDRPIGWTQHVTLGPPFLQRGVTQFRASATCSKVFEHQFGAHDYLQAGAEFDWPFAPATDGKRVDLQLFTAAAASSAYTVHLMDPARVHAFFVAYSPTHQLAFGYVWKTSDFPWMGIWEENGSRTGPPWNGRVLTRGMEFGVSPMPETRREMIGRGPLFGVPTFRWIPARSAISVEYQIQIATARAIPQSLDWID